MISQGAGNTAAKLSPLALDDDEDETPSNSNPSSLWSKSQPEEVTPDNFPGRTEVRSTTLASERLTRLHKKTQEKIKAMREVREKELVSECTFSPRLNSSSPPRSFNEFYLCQKVYESSRQDRIAKMQTSARMKQEAEEKEIGSTQMSPGSKHILASSSHVMTLIEKLNVPKRVGSPPARPQPVSVKATREEIEEIVSRLAYLKPEPSQISYQLHSQRSFKSEKSEEIVCTALEKEIERHWTDLDLQEKVNYLQLEYLLMDMHYVTPTDKALMYQAWVDMKGTENLYISKPTVVGFLLALSGFSPQSVSLEDTTSSEALVIQFSPSPSLKAKYQPFINNHLMHGSSTKRQVDSDPVPQSHTSKNSEQILRKLRENLPDETFQERLEDRRTQRKQVKMTLALTDMMKECTFQPKVTHLRSVSPVAKYVPEGEKEDAKHMSRTDMLYTHGKALAYKKNNVQPVDHEYERNKAELIFSPVLSARTSPKRMEKKPPGYERVVERLRTAYADSQKRTQLMSRGVPLTHPKISSPKSPKPPLLTPVLKSRHQANPQPFSHELDELLMSEESEIVASIQLPSGRTTELILKPGEDLESKVQSLAATEALTPAELNSILVSLRQEICPLH